MIARLAHTLAEWLLVIRAMWFGGLRLAVDA